jgi:hypothetical protein
VAKTKQSATPSIRLMMSSTSSGKTFSPPVLMTEVPRPSNVMVPSV